MKLKIKLGKISIEVEGSKEEIEFQYKLIKNDLLNGIYNRQSSVRAGEQLPLLNESTSTSTDSQSNNIITPGINIINKMIFSGKEKKESDWILIFGYAITDGKETTFSKSQIVKLFKDKDMFTESRSKNLNVNIKSAKSKGLIGNLNDNDFFVTPKGKQYVEDILKELM